jgi:prophage antirepressor-like protein
MSDEETNDSLYPAIFGEHQIRRVWHEDRWFYAVVDVIAALTDSTNPRQYWRDTKKRMDKEGDTQTQEKILPFKMMASDNKMRDTECADTETMLRIIQSIPSPKAEPFKRWLAEVGNDRIEELNNPELGYQEWRRRAIASYVAQGYSEEWAALRVETIVSRNDLTEEWAVRGIDEKDYAALTDRLHMGSFGLSIQEHMGLKEYPVTRKGRRVVHKGNLREGMTASELVVTQIGQLMARAQHIDNDSHGIVEITRDIDVAGQVANAARQELIARTGQQIPSPTNAIPTTNTLWGSLPAPDKPKE